LYFCCFFYFLSDDQQSRDVCSFGLAHFCSLFSGITLLCLPGTCSSFFDLPLSSHLLVLSICSSRCREPDLDLRLASSSFLFSAFLELVRPSSNPSALRICRIYDISYSNLLDPYINLSPDSSTFLDLQIYSTCLICSSTLHCQFIMMTLTNEPFEIHFGYEKGKLAFDLRYHSGREEHDQRDELAARIDKHI
jgi:hypothetical protein